MNHSLAHTSTKGIGYAKPITKRKVKTMSQSQVLSNSCGVSRTEAPQTLLSKVFAAMNMARSRRALAKLDAHLLADIGITAKQAQEEAQLSTWNAPSFWRM
jgi:uncharacterized protein YjiS (DUF1127 family)